MDATNSENLRDQLGMCFTLIRFGAIEGEEIGEILANELYEGLFTRAEFADILQTKWNKNFQSKLFNHQRRSKLSIEWNEN